MSTEIRPSFWPPAPESIHRLRRNWFWFVLLGIALLILGFLAMSATLFAGEFVTVFIGFMLLFSGGAEIANAVLSGRWRGFFAHLVVGILYLIAGIFLVLQPGAGLAALTLLVGVSFTVGGLFHIIVALNRHFHYWGWVLANGILMLLLGILIWQGWPYNSVWVLGLLVGIELVFDGITWIALGLAVRDAFPAA
jgi:uncharacterized membrane protein HdeD (DUF308 family)